MTGATGPLDGVEDAVWVDLVFEAGRYRLQRGRGAGPGVAGVNRQLGAKLALLRCEA